MHSRWKKSWLRWDQVTESHWRFCVNTFTWPRGLFSGFLAFSRHSNGNIELKHWYWCWTLQCWKIHFLWLITLDECYVHFHAQEAKIKIKQWKHSFWLPPNTKTLLFVRKIMFTVIWDCHGVILTDYLPRGCTIFCMCYQSLLQKLRKWSAIDVGCCSEAFLCFMTICQLMELMSLPLASSARIKSCPHSPFSPGLALSDFFVFLEKSASWTYFFLTIGTWLLNWICSGHRQWSSPFRASRKWSRYGRNVSPCLVNT